MVLIPFDIDKNKELLVDKVKKEQEHKKMLEKYNEPTWIDKKLEISFPQDLKKPKRDINNAILQKLLTLIDNGGTGFDLAYEIEKNNLIKELNYDGIIFYNYFKGLGKKRVNDLPDNQVSDFKTFKTKEDSKKKIFIDWISRLISDNGAVSEVIDDDYESYVKTKKVAEITECPNCGAIFESNTQKICEICGHLRKVS